MDQVSRSFYRVKNSTVKDIAYRRPRIHRRRWRHPLLPSGRPAETRPAAKKVRPHTYRPSGVTVFSGNPKTPSPAPVARYSISIASPYE
jgi:hypothetical protein